jgi:hypothetical protein
MAQRIGGSRRVGHESIHVEIAVAVREVHTGDVAMAGNEATAPYVDPCLYAEQLAAGPRIREGLVVVVDLLGEDTGPGGMSPALTVRTGIFSRQRIANALVQCAKYGEPCPSGAHAACTVETPPATMNAATIVRNAHRTSRWMR